MMRLRLTWAPVWGAAWAVALAGTVIYGLGVGFPLWDLIALWVIAAVMTIGLWLVPPVMISGWRRDEPPGDDDSTRPLPELDA